MMRSSPTGTAESAMRTSPAARTVVRLWDGVNRRLTKLSTKAEAFYRRYSYPDWLETHSRVVGAIAEALVAGRRRGAPPIDVDSVVLAAYLHDIGRSPLLAGDARDHNILSGIVLAAEGLGACIAVVRSSSRSRTVPTTPRAGTRNTRPRSCARSHMQRPSNAKCSRTCRSRLTTFRRRCGDRP